MRHIRHAEREIRCWIRGEEGAHLEHAVARLICAIIVSRLEPPTPAAPLGKLDPVNKMSSEKPPRELNAPAKRGRKAGRSVGLTPRIQQIICDTIAAGNYQNRAAQAAGISRETLKKWRARGRRGVEPYASLEKAIEQADRDCETALVAKVMAATSDDWRAAALMLERKYPENWSRYRERALLESSGGLAMQAFQINIHLGETHLPAARAAALPAPPDKDPDSNLN